MAIKVRPAQPGVYSVFDQSARGYRRIGALVNRRRSGRWYFEPAVGSSLPELEVTAEVKGPAASLETAIAAALSLAGTPLGAAVRH